DRGGESSPRSGRHPADLQAAAHAHDRGAVRAIGGTGDQGEAEPSDLPGNAAGSGDGRTRAKLGGAAIKGCALSQSEDDGGVRVRSVVASAGGITAETC